MTDFEGDATVVRLILSFISIPELECGKFMGVP
jgi:hypothetical protein